jgi:RNA polymerase sigma-70 factor (ECF subfamily)
MTGPNRAFREELALAQQGVAGAVARVLEPHRELLKGFAKLTIPDVLRSQVGNSDIVQDTFARACEKLGDFRGDCEAQLVAWLKEILKNRVEDVRRAQQRRIMAGVDPRPIGSKGGGEPFARERTPSSIFSAGEQTDRVQRAFEVLPDDVKSIVRMREDERISFVEIGKRMDRSADAVRMAWFRALQKVRAALQEDKDENKPQ